MSNGGAASTRSHRPQAAHGEQSPAPLLRSEPRRAQGRCRPPTGEQKGRTVRVCKARRRAELSSFSVPKELLAAFPDEGTTDPHFFIKSNTNMQLNFPAVHCLNPTNLNFSEKKPKVPQKEEGCDIPNRAAPVLLKALPPAEGHPGAAQYTSHYLFFNFQGGQEH